MEQLKDVAHIAGRPGLFKIIKPGRSGVIVESLDASKKKEIVSVNAKISVLKDISIFTTDYDKSTPLEDVFRTIYHSFPDGIELDLKGSDKDELFDFMGSVMPDFDPERVYSSDVKKLIQWYRILSAEMPELFLEQKEQAKEDKE